MKTYFFSKLFHSMTSYSFIGFPQTLNVPLSPLCPVTQLGDQKAYSALECHCVTMNQAKYFNKSSEFQWFVFDKRITDIWI